MLENAATLQEINEYYTIGDLLDLNFALDLRQYYTDKAIEKAHKKQK